ncbi:MAG: TIGR03943 family protein [Deltaproteobacteria bacterium]|nr:TIGR03943 family protein [Deltaproteobacteria bacterium]
MKEKLIRSATFLTACLPALIYISWLNAYFWLLEDGRYKAFIQPKLWPLLILALILLLAFSAACISQFSLKSIISLQFDAWIKAAILIVPVVFLWTIYGHSLGADAFAKRLLHPGQSISIETTNSNQIPSQAFSGRAITLLDLILNAEKFNGKRVAVEGMVYRAAKVDKHGFLLFRFAVACCAADAVPFSIQVNTATEADLNNDSWVRVEGFFSLEKIDDKEVRSVLADKILPIPKPLPEKRYLFF